MGTKTISLADDAYERLKAAKKDDESFSDVVRRITPGVALSDYVGVLDDETADELETIIDERRTERDEDRRKRAEDIADALNTE